MTFEYYVEWPNVEFAISDLIIRGGLIAKGCGTERADVGIRDGVIVQIGNISDARPVIDVAGTLFKPGGGAI